MVCLVDVSARVVAAAGVAGPEQCRGRPLQGRVDGSAKDWQKEVFSQISEVHTGRVIRTRKWKYEVWVPNDGKEGSGNAAPGSDRYHEHHLYDLEADPHERNDLVRDPAYAPIRAELAATLQRRMAHAGEARAEILPA